jgi:hypothetical protein
MKKADKNFSQGVWLFAFLMVSIFASMYFANVAAFYPTIAFTIMKFTCPVISIILALGLLLLLLQTNRAFIKDEEEIALMRQHEKNRMQKFQQTKEGILQNQKIFNADEALSRIMPNAGWDFDSIAAYTENLLQNIAQEMEIVTGLVFVLNDTDQMFHISGQYAYYSEEQPRSFSLDETLSGQVAKNRKLLYIKDLPKDYISVISGLGKSVPSHLMIAPIVHNYKSIGVIELASFKPFNESHELIIKRVSESMADLLNELRNHV